MRISPPLLRAMAAATLLVSAPVAAQQEPAPGDGEATESRSGDEGDDGGAEPAVAPGEAGEALENPAGEGVPEPPSRRIAVLLLATSGVDPETADSLTELAIGAVAGRGGVTIVGKEEFQAQLGQGEARSIECISSSACLGRIGVELAVDEVIAGTIGRRNGRWTFNLNRIDIQSGELAGRDFREVDGDLGAVADAIEEAIPALYEDVQRPATVLVSASEEGAEVTVDGILVGVYRGEPVSVGDMAPGQHHVVVELPGYQRWERTVRVAEGATLQLEADLEEPDRPGEAYVSPLVWVGAGIVAAGAGTALFFGLSSQRSADEDLNRAEAEDFVDARRTDALVANVALGTIAAGLVVGGLGLAFSDLDGADPAAGGTTVGAAPVPGGAVGVVEGSF